MTKKKSRKTGIIAALISAFASSWIIIIQKKYLSITSEMEINYLMYLGASLGIFFFYKTSEINNKKKKITKEDKKKIILLSFLEFLSSVIIIRALKVERASVVSILLNFELIATAIIGRKFNNLELSKYAKVAVIIVTLASIILNYDGTKINILNEGFIEVILCCICWGIENNLVETINVNSAIISIGKTTGVAIGQLLLSLVTAQYITLDYPMLIIYGIITFGVGIYTYALAVENISATEATTIFSLQSIMSAVLAILIYKDPITPQLLLSAALMMFGIILMNKKQKA